MKRLLLISSIFIFFVSFSGLSLAETITFDEFPATNWNQAPPGLSSEYAYLGVTFITTDDGSVWDGLSDGDPGNWDLEGTNGDNFLGFNGASYSSDLRFDTAITNFSFDVSRSLGSSNEDGFTVRAFDGSHNLLETQTIEFGGINQWSTITLAAAGIMEIDWIGVGYGFHPFGVDNLNWDTAPVPEPATMLLFGTGLIGLAGMRRRKKK